MLCISTKISFIKAGDNRKQKVEINDSFSSWIEILFGVPHGSIPQSSTVGPLLFNIFICDLFYFLEDYEIANYADNSFTHF